MKKVRCIFNAFSTKLSEGKEYSVYRDLPKHYVIIGDNARFIKVTKDRFIGA